MNMQQTATMQGDLAVHKRKIQDVRQWLLEAADGGPSGKLKKYRVRLSPLQSSHNLIHRSSAFSS